jgi:3-dehydroquinate dehydratase
MNWTNKSPGIDTTIYNGWHITRLSKRGKDPYGHTNYDYVANRIDKPFKENGQAVRFTGTDLNKIKKAIDLTYEITLF